MEARSYSSEERNRGLAPALIPDWAEPTEVVLIWPERIRAGVGKLRSFYRKFIDQLTEHINVRLIINPELDALAILSQFSSPKRIRIEKINCPDIWIRDFMPLAQRFHQKRTCIKALYSPAYLKGRNEVFAIESNNAAILISESLSMELDIITNEDGLPLVLDGGNITVNAQGLAISTTRILGDNENWSPEELHSTFARKLGINELLVVPCEPGDVTGHIDGMVRFIDNDTIAVADYATGYNRKFMDKIAESCYEKGLNVMRITNAETSATVRNDGSGISSARGNFVNFFRCGSMVYLPKYERLNKEFELAEAAFQAKGIEVIAVNDVDDLAMHGGVLNCVTWAVF